MRRFGQGGRVAAGRILEQVVASPWRPAGQHPGRGRDEYQYGGADADSYARTRTDSRASTGMGAVTSASPRPLGRRRVERAERLHELARLCARDLRGALRLCAALSDACTAL